MLSMLDLDDESAIEDDNPYRSPRADMQVAVGRRVVRYPSAIKAIRAGSWRGAKFGAKWVGLFLGGLAFILCAFVGIRIYFYIYRQGIDVRYVLESFFILLRFFLFVLIATFGTSLITSIMMGIGEGIAYWRLGGKSGSAGPA
jgi:hypothetical protein